MRTLLLLPLLATLGAADAVAGEAAPDPLLGGDPAAGEIWFRQSCAMCHPAPGALFSSGADTPTAQELDRFLANHRAPNPDMRRDLIAFLLRGSTDAETGR
ncbi:MAG: hypothetical protein KDK29_10320 [Sedimentitalea sp.]|nr:hypothetical protein [Sedimentitalea sp.]